MDKRFVRGEYAVTARQEIALEPSLTAMFAEDFHDAAVRRDVVVRRKNCSGGATAGNFEDCVEPVRRCLVGSEETKTVRIVANDLAQKLAGSSRALVRHPARRGDVDCVAAEFGKDKASKDFAAVRIWIGAHAQRAAGCGGSD